MTESILSKSKWTRTSLSSTGTLDVELDPLGQVSPLAVLFEGELAFGSLT